MDNLTLVIIWGLLGFLSCVFGVIITYRTQKQAYTSLFAQIEGDEKDLLDEIEKRGVAELAQTQAGRELLALCGSKVEHVRQMRQREPHTQEQQLVELMPKPPVIKITEKAGSQLEDTIEKLRQLTASISVMPLYANLSAGSGVWLGSEDSIEGYLEFDSLLIHGRRYSIYSVTGQLQALQIKRDYFLGAARVSGNSMNRLNIEDNDYVIFQKPRSGSFAPQNDDIVAVVIRDQHDLRVGTIKRYRQSDDRIMLMPESNEPQWIPQTYKHSEVDFIGKVIAVLKEA